MTADSRRRGLRDAPPKITRRRSPCRCLRLFNRSSRSCSAGRLASRRVEPRSGRSLSAHSRAGGSAGRPLPVRRRYPQCFLCAGSAAGLAALWAAEAFPLFLDCFRAAGTLAAGCRRGGFTSETMRRSSPNSSSAAATRSAGNDAFAEPAELQRVARQQQLSDAEAGAFSRRIPGPPSLSTSAISCSTGSSLGRCFWHSARSSFRFRCADLAQLRLREPQLGLARIAGLLLLVGLAMSVAGRPARDRPTAGGLPERPVAPDDLRFVLTVLLPVYLAGGFLATFAAWLPTTPKAMYWGIVLSDGQGGKAFPMAYSMGVRRSSLRRLLAHRLFRRRRPAAPIAPAPRHAPQSGAAACRDDLLHRVGGGGGSGRRRWHRALPALVGPGRRLRPPDGLRVSVPRL